MNEIFQNNPSDAYTVNNYFRQEEIRKEEEKKEETIPLSNTHHRAHET